MFKYGKSKLLLNYDKCIESLKRKFEWLHYFRQTDVNG